MTKEVHTGRRIKDLQDAEPIATEQFDTFLFPLDVPLEDSTCNLSGKALKKYVGELQLTDMQRAVLALLSVDADGNLKSSANFYTSGWLSQLGPATGSGSGGGGGTAYHDQLLNLDYPDQHPIAAVTGLKAALDGKLNASAISAWALEPEKPAYSLDEITGLQTALDTKLPLAGGNLTGNLTIAGNQVWHSGNFDPAGKFDKTGGEVDGDLYVKGHSGYRDGGRTWLGRDNNGAFFNSDDASGATTAQLRLWNNGRITFWKPGIGNDPYELWHSGNSNLPTADWTARNLTVAGSVTVDGNIIVKGTITQLGATGVDDGTNDSFVERPVPGEFWDGKQVYIRSFQGMTGNGGFILSTGILAIHLENGYIRSASNDIIPPGYINNLDQNKMYNYNWNYFSNAGNLHIMISGTSLFNQAYYFTFKYTKL